MEGMPGEAYDRPVIYRPDHDVVTRLLEYVYRREADLHIKLDITDVRDGRIQTVFVRWGSGDLETFVQRIQAALNTSPSEDRYEPYFWLFWRGWAGCLDAEILLGLPAVSDDLVDKVRQGVPLRGSDLRRLQTALEWAFANAAGEWGATDTWQDDTISPGHLGLRRKVSDFIEQRMVELHGPHYDDAPVER